MAGLTIYNLGQPNPAEIGNLSAQRLSLSRA